MGTSGDLDSLAISQIGYGLGHVMETIDNYCELLREVAPNSSPAMHAIMHMGTANAELGSAEQLLGDVE